MSENTLLGVSDGFALFGNDKGLTVVVNLSNLDVFDPLPELSVDFSRWSDADPAVVPTEAYGLADGALATASRVAGTDILIASAAPDKRSFATPRGAREAAHSGLLAVKKGGETPTPVTLAMARALTSEAPLNIVQVRHISSFFSGKDDVTEATKLLWGGDHAKRWADGIMTREKDLATLSALDFSADEDTQEMEPVDPEAADDADSSVEAGEPHTYVPDPLHEYACEECGQDEDMLVHDVALTEESAPETEPAPVVAGGITKPIATADQFFNVEVDREDVIPDFYLVFEARADGTPSMITGILAHRMDGTWAQWSRKSHNWSDTAEPSDAFPVDDDSAYETAILFDTHDKDAIPAHEIDQFEWDQVQKALPQMPDFKPAELEDLDFCVVMGEDKINKTVIIEELYMRDDDGNCWRWNPVDIEWQKSSRCPKDCTSVDADTAREAAARLSAEASKKATGSQRRRFHGLPEANSRLGPKLSKPHGPYTRPSARNPGPLWEFDSAFSRAAWVINTHGGQSDGPPGFSPGSTATSFAAMDEFNEGYTSEERSKNAAQQVRDSQGRFTKSGATVHVKDTNDTAVVVAVNARTGMVKIRYANGAVKEIDAKRLVNIGGKDDDASGGASKPKFDPKSIRSKPRAVGTTPKGMLDKLYEPMDAAALKKVVEDYQAFIEEERKRKLSKYAALTPETTDVAPLYIAQVDEHDKQAVVELIALVPKTKTTSEVYAFVRAEGGWKRDDKMLSKIKSTSPPPLVTLDHGTFEKVLTQVDSYFKENKGGSEEPKENAEASLIAALQARVDTALWDETGALIPVFEAEAMVAGGIPGIADTPGDFAAARRLRRYWLRGRGAAKIRWNTPGDWTRCVKHLSKYMGPRSKGYCQNLHKAATGVYTGSKYNVGKKRGLRADGSALLLSSPTSVLASAADVTPDTQFLALLEIDEPSVMDLAELTPREAGHQLRVGERFLVNGGDGVYAISVLEPTSTIGWEGAPAILVASAETNQVELLQEAGA